MSSLYFFYRKFWVTHRVENWSSLYFFHRIFEVSHCVMDTIRGQNEKLYASIQKKLCFTLQILGHSPHYEKVVKMRNFTQGTQTNFCLYYFPLQILGHSLRAFCQIEKLQTKKSSVYIVFHFSVLFFKLLSRIRWIYRYNISEEILRSRYGIIPSNTCQNL